MSRYTFTTEDGHSWFVGYDMTAGAYFADEERPGAEEPIEHGAEGKLLTYADLERELATVVGVPARVRALLKIEDPASSVAARAAALARIDQVGAGLRDTTAAQSARPTQRWSDEPPRQERSLDR